MTRYKNILLMSKGMRVTGLGYTKHGLRTLRSLLRDMKKGAAVTYEERWVGTHELRFDATVDRSGIND